MELIYSNGRTILKDPADFDADKILDCGQCFRWEKRDGQWRGIAKGSVLTLRQNENEVCFDCSREDFQNLWYDYFDLARDYGAVRQQVSLGAYMTKAAAFGEGIRILRQEPWETLCTFILSQCNNIPRIKGIVDKLCRFFGEEIEENTYAFPKPEKLAALDETALLPLRSGYRAAYLLSAARDVCDGRIDLDALAKGSAAAAEQALLSMNGVGKKVASCVLLFGLGKTEAFPIDTWMRKAMKQYFEPGFAPAVFGKNGGIAQQYIFYYARWGGCLG